MNIFHIAEIIDIGIEKEKMRREFYALVARQFEQPKMRSLFERLRDWESEHIEKFTKLREGVEPLESTESFPGEMAAYMRSLVDDRLYADATPASFKAHVTTPLEAIQRGIQFERDAILFFSEAAPYVTGPSAEALRLLIEEERKHIVYLTGLRRELGL